MEQITPPKSNRKERYSAYKKKKRSARKERGTPRATPSTKEEEKEDPTPFPTEETTPFPVSPENNESNSDDRSNIERISDAEMQSSEESESSYMSEGSIQRSQRSKMKGKLGSKKSQRNKKGRRKRSKGKVKRDTDNNSTKSSFGIIPELPTDFTSFPDFLAEQFGGILPSKYILQGLLYATLSCDSYQLFDRSMAMGGEISRVIGNKTFEFHMNHLIQLLIIWDFLCTRQNNKLKLKVNEPVVFDLFMKFKEKHFERVANSYREFSESMNKPDHAPPPYTPVSPAMKQM